VPAGILPFLSIFFWKNLDSAARALALTAITYFFLFYIQAQTALHHFVPAMLLPVAVFWRRINQSPPRREAAFALSVAAAAVLALVLSLPASTRLYIESRLVGASISDRIFHEQGNPAGYAGLSLFQMLFPRERDEGAGARFTVSPLVLRYYSHRAGPGQHEPGYVLQRRSESPPPGAVLVGSDSSGALYALSESILARHRGLRPTPNPGAAIYEVPPQYRYRNDLLRNDPGVFSLLRGLGRIGVDTVMLRARGWRH
jgi:hypothetical protein